MPDIILPDPPGYAELSTLDKIRYIQSLWDKIADEPDDLRVPESHLELARARLKSYDENPSAAVPAFEMLDEVMREP